MEPRGYYHYKKMPHVAKSKIKTHSYFCPYLFYTKYVLGEKPEDFTKRCDVGTDTHLIFSSFWDNLDFDYLYTLEINPTIGTENNPVTYYFYGICMSITPEYDREVAVLQRIFWKFACIHADRFLYLYQLFNGNKFKVWKYFKPVEVEEFYYSEEFEIYGTIDTVFLEIDESLDEGIYVADYKTGKIPNKVLKGRKHIADETSVEVPPKFMFEVHFYALLYLLKRGWNFKDERVRKFIIENLYLDEDGNWKKFGLGTTKEEQKEIDDEKRKYIGNIDHKLYRFNQKTQKFQSFEHGDIILGIIFLTGDPDIQNPVVVKKKFNYTSLKTVLFRINEIRQSWFYRNEDKYYPIRRMKTRPEYNKYRCVNCSRNEDCLKEIENEFRGI